MSYYFSAKEQGCNRVIQGERTQVNFKKKQEMYKLFITLFSAFTLVLLRPAAAKEVSQDNVERAEYSLQIIKEYSVTSPDRAQDELYISSDLRKFLPRKKQIDWLIQSAVVANRLNDFSLSESTLTALYYSFMSELTAKERGLFFYFLGHVNLKRGDNDTAIKIYNCALKSYTKENFALRAMFSIANALIAKGDYELSEAVMRLLLAEVNRQKIDKWKAAPTNVLGIFALHRKNYGEAESYFRQAMDLHQKNRNKAGEYNASLNLLLVFALTSNFEMFERLKDRLARTGEQLLDQDRVAYFSVIKYLEKFNKNKGLNESDMAAMLSDIDSIKSMIVKTAVSSFIAPEINLNLVKEKTQITTLDWVKEIQEKESCTDDKLDFSFMSVEIE
ncbi:hypothetical protein ACFSJY_06415 [Thalassotalea euphylliae]|uniref:tetratricopeptide repeat protein n=1 Tax=Thalassotalea euphylliae TaxID=1655234 RepID=UPI00362D2EE2